MDHTTVVEKGSEHRLCQETKGKGREEHFGPVSYNCSTAIITLEEALDNGYAT